MTAKEAIMQIQAIPEKIWNQLSEPDNEAINMAISALQAQDSPKPTAESVQNVQNEDLISRKAATDALDNIKIPRNASWYPYYQQALTAVSKLPSAQPEREKGEWTKDCACEICGFKPWYERDIHTLSFCPNCGADMRGDNHDQSK